MNVLVTGGNGFIGQHTVKALQAVGHTVTIFDVPQDIMQDSEIFESLADMDAVIHLAARKSIPGSMADPIGFAGINVLGTVKLLDACVKQKVKKFVFASSSSAYNPRNPYAASKLAAEQFCMAFSETYGLNVTCLRYFNVYGPGQDGSSDLAAVIPAFIHKLRNHQHPVIYGTGEQRRDFTYVKDVAEANAEALYFYKSGVLDVGTGKHYSVNEVLQEIQTYFAPKTPIYLPGRKNDVALSQANSVFKMKYTLAEGLKEMIHESA